MSEPFDTFVGQQVVLDTSGPIVYLGRLVEANQTGFVLADADLHDCRDGHATKEVYINEACQHGISPNRRRIFVLRSAIMSISALADVIEQ